MAANDWNPKCMANLMGFNKQNIIYYAFGFCTTHISGSN